MAYIILDKDYLQGEKAETIFDLCKEHVLLITWALFYELMTTAPKEREKCFKHLPDNCNILIIHNVEYLRGYELENQKACTPIHAHALKGNLKFNKGLREGTFKFTKEQINGIKLHEKQLKERTENMLDRAMQLPTIISCEEGTLTNKKIEDIKQDIATDSERVLEFYRWLIENDNTQKHIIKPEQLNSNWLEFRWVQINIIYALDLLLRYRGNIPSNSTKKFWQKIEHDLLDMEYVILGSLTGALASKEKRVREMFKLVCPNGLLIP
ncbi:MAG: hypothetical protein CVU52_06760 [Deltaproteobacteria bacterium HGW-Deltaproteobacteria-10]|nr:MAG: hypothetical protein CVU52_06760 [Deltaproteobacteria bacterium HGW-Deltaproteobacteria-10]